MLYNQPKMPLKNCASCRGRACPARCLPPYHFYDSIRRGGIYPSRALPAAASLRGGQRAGRPTTPLKMRVGRGALTPPQFTGISLLRFIRREKSCPSRGASGTPPPTIVAVNLPPFVGAAYMRPANLPPYLFPLHAPSVHFPKFIHFFVKKSTKKNHFVL